MQRDTRRSRPDRGGWTLLLVAVLLVAAGLWSAAPAAEQGATAEKESYSPYAGKVTFRVFCSNCHGAAGKGDGYLVESLKVRPSNLTVLTKENQGVFPEERVWRAIDGRDAVRGHPPREMPVWGEAFLWPENTPDKKEEVQRKIGELVEFLKTIQEKSGAPPK